MDKRMAETPRHNISFLKKRETLFVCPYVQALLWLDLIFCSGKHRWFQVPTASMSLLGLIHGWNG
jgi:hypothetical protein